MGFAARGRKVEEREGQFVLREDATPYRPEFDPEKGVLSPENAYLRAGFP